MLFIIMLCSYYWLSCSFLILWEFFFSIINDHAFYLKRSLAVAGGMMIAASYSLAYEGVTFSDIEGNDSQFPTSQLVNMKNSDFLHFFCTEITRSILTLLTSPPTILFMYRTSKLQSVRDYNNRISIWNRVHSTYKKNIRPVWRFKNRLVIHHYVSQSKSLLLTLLFYLFLIYWFHWRSLFNFYITLLMNPGINLSIIYSLILLFFCLFISIIYLFIDQFTFYLLISLFNCLSTRLFI